MVFPSYAVALKADLLAQARTLVLGIPAALAVFAVILLVSSPVLGDLPLWIGEAILGSIAGFLWMGVGFLVARPSASAAVTLFGTGALLAWWLNIGVVHDVSPYHGLAGFLTSSGVALITGGSFLARAHGGRRTSYWLAACVVVMATGVVRPLWKDLPGQDRDLFDASGQRHRVGIAHVVTQGEEAMYVWTSRGLAEQLQGAGPVPEVQIIRDPGSGGGSYELVPVTDAEIIETVLGAMQTDARQDLLDEIETGFTAPIFRRWPLPDVQRSGGAVWRATRAM